MTLFISSGPQQHAMDNGDDDDNVHKDQKLSKVMIQATSESLTKTSTDASMKGLNIAKVVKEAETTIVSTDATRAPDAFDIFQSIKETTRIRSKLDNFFGSNQDEENFTETINQQRQLAEVINQITTTDRPTMLKVLKSLTNKNIELFEDIVKRAPDKVNISYLNCLSHGCDSIAEIGKPDQGTGVVTEKYPQSWQDF